MKLSEIFSQLTYGELSQIHLGGADTGVIDETNYPKVLAHLNMGLLALYKRFPIKQSRTTITMVPGTPSYTLSVPDLLKIERVYTEKQFEMGLNDESDIYSNYTPVANVLVLAPDVVAQGQDLPDPLKTSTLEVVYRASHPMLLIDGGGYLDPDEVDVELPYSHLEPLLYYVASRVNNPMGMSQEFHAGNSWYAKYEAACQELERINLRVDQGSQNNRLVRNGWV